MPSIAFRQLDDISYRTQLVNLVKPLEDAALASRPPSDTNARGLKPQWDGNTNLAIGYGTDLFVNSPADIRARLSAVGVLYSDPDWLRIETAISTIKATAKTFIAGHSSATSSANRGRRNGDILHFLAA